MKTISELQNKVNEIAEELGGLETNKKLTQARLIARRDETIQGLLLDILDDALVRRWNKDMSESIARFFQGILEKK